MFTTKVIYTAGTEYTLAIFCTGARPYCAAECICEQIAAPASSTHRTNSSSVPAADSHVSVTFFQHPC